MARKSTRNAQGSGSIRQRTDGRWEARFTYTDELGQKKRASVYADTQKECRQKLTAALKSVDGGYVFLDETKNGKQRIVAIAPSIVRVLRDQEACGGASVEQSS